jgi:hypothetical protein
MASFGPSFVIKASKNGRVPLASTSIVNLMVRTNIDIHNQIFRSLQEINNTWQHTRPTSCKNRANYTETSRTATHSTKDKTNTSSKLSNITIAEIEQQNIHKISILYIKR